MSTLTQPRQDPIEEARRLLATGGTKGGNSYYACPESASRQALELLTAAGGTEAQDDQVRALCARAYRWLGHIGNAWSLLDHVTDTDSPELFAEAGWLAVDYEEYAAAHEFFEVVLDRNPRLPDAVSGMVSALLATHGPAEADDLIEQLVLADAINPYSEHVERGWIRLADEDYTSALDEFESACVERPNSLDAALGRIVCLRDLGRYTEAQQLCEDARAKFPTSAACRVYLGWIELAQGHYEAALANFFEARELNSAFPDAIDGQLASLRNLDRTWEARKIIHELPAHLVQLRSLRIEAGFTNFQAGAYAAAEEAFADAAQRDVWVKQKPEPWQDYATNVRWRSLRIPWLRHVREGIERRAAATMATSGEFELTAVVDDLPGWHDSSNPDHAAALKDKVRGHVLDGLWREQLIHATESVLIGRYRWWLVVWLGVAVGFGALYLVTTPPLLWPMVSVAVIYGAAFGAVGFAVSKSADILLTDQAILKAVLTITVVAGGIAVSLLSITDGTFEERPLVVAAAAGIVVALFLLWVPIYGWYGANAGIRAFRLRRLERHHPDEVISLELVRLISQMDYRPAWHELARRRQWSDSLERIARTLEHALARAVPRTDRATGWVDEMVRGVGTGLRHLRGQVLAPDSGTPDAVITTLGSMVVNVAGGRWRQLPSKESVSVRERITWLRVQRYLQALVAAGLPALIYWIYQTFIAPPEYQLPDWVGLVVYVAWPAITILVHIDPHFFDKLSAVRGTGESIREGRRPGR